MFKTHIELKKSKNIFRNCHRAAEQLENKQILFKIKKNYFKSFVTLNFSEFLAEEE